MGYIEAGKTRRRIARRRMDTATSEGSHTLAQGSGLDSPLLQAGNLAAIGARVRDLARAPLVTCRASTTVREAAEQMNVNRISSVVVVNEAGEAVGIVTDWDLRERVVAAGRDVNVPVCDIMSQPVLTIPADEPVLEAVRLMIGRNIHHLVVVEGARPVGMVTGHDLIVLQGTSALFIAREIERQSDFAGLRRVLEQVHRLIPFLMSQGLGAWQIGRVIAEINDRLVSRALELTEIFLGPAPVPYCWLTLGSEGRREQTFKTDQDNALLYADPPPGAAESVRSYFLELGRRAVSALVEIGFPPCPGNYTADNPQWTQSLSGWYQLFHRWIAIPEPQAVLNSLIFFDFRGIYGDLSLALRLRDHITGLVPGNRLFVLHLANLSTAQAPPIGFLGRFIVEKSGEHRNELDLKFKGTARIVDLVRFFSLQHGIIETNTLSRLELLKDNGYLSRELANELSQAFGFLLDLRIRRQWEQMRAGQARSNFIDPKSLTLLERSALRQAFQTIARVQAHIREEYHSERIAD